MCSYNHPLQRKNFKRSAEKVDFNQIHRLKFNLKYLFMIASNIFLLQFIANMFYVI
ncbi:transmembrane protein, putative (macronuclear) [Tetrahymena thermophila SB210]|uniref:Transmembrane protein, putative n=1 Tax=Tetrahymena thermophila (strain SB210) TaxID=312017 RepID=W7X6Y4_TETTS|nr:transmembrane protein, putative [Tetrahymena thermophila SB210]EWS72148.1 transmembrane protein, putative [Tetrahymena thermophila SB210]|eukprot:XP_012655310.1 transmembrane protein, putative [Tetrahymena thermophila SB210]